MSTPALNPGERLMTAREVAQQLHIHVNTLVRIPEELLPVIRVARRGDRRYRRVDVQRYLDRLNAR